jgi:hypothetical protein
VTLKAVQAALWKGSDGSAGVFLANADTETHPFDFSFDPKTCGFGSAPLWSVTRITPDGGNETLQQSGDPIEYTTEVPGRSAVLLIFRPEMKP